MDEEYDDTGVDMDDTSDSGADYDDSSMDAGDDGMDDSGCEDLPEDEGGMMDAGGEGMEDASPDEGLDDSGADEGMDAEEPTDDGMDTEEPVDEGAEAEAATDADSEAADEGMEDLPEDDASETEEPADTDGEAADAATEDLPEDGAPETEEPADTDCEAADATTEDLPEDDAPETEEPADTDGEAADAATEDLPEDGAPETEEPADTDGEAADAATEDLPEAEQPPETDDPAAEAGETPNENDSEAPADSSDADDPDAAYQKLSDYMSDHNYGMDDYDTYSQDPEWQDLHQKAFPDHYEQNDLPTDNGSLTDDASKDLPEERFVEYDDPGRTKDIRQKDYDRQSTADAEGLNMDQRSSLERYSGDDYRKMNDSLRGKDVDYVTPQQEQRINDQIDNVTDVLDQKELPKDTNLYRGMDSPKHILGDDYQAKSLDQLRQENIGKVYTDDGFCSTSTSHAKAADFSQARDGTMVEISAPKGSNGMYMGDVSTRPYENEVLLQRGSAFRIDGIDYSMKDGYTIKSTLIGRKG